MIIELQSIINPLTVEFFIPFRGHGDNYKPSSGTDIFSMFTVWYGLCSLVLMFPGLRIEAPPHLQYRLSVYTFLKRRTINSISALLY